MCVCVCVVGGGVGVVVALRESVVQLKSTFWTGQKGTAVHRSGASLKGGLAVTASKLIEVSFSLYPLLFRPALHTFSVKYVPIAP